MKIRRGVVLAVLIVITMMLASLLAVTAHAEDASDIDMGTCGIFRDTHGNRYLIIKDRIKYGEQSWRGNYYYAYKSGVRRAGDAPRGSLCCNAFRRLGKNRWRYYRKSGAALKASTAYIKLYDFYGKYVQYIYVPGTDMCQRYNCKKERYEIRSSKKSRKWREVGHQFYWDHDRRQ